MADRWVDFVVDFFFVVIFLRDMEVEIVPVLFCPIGVLLQRWVDG